MTLVVYNARRQVFVQECAYLFLIAALRQKQNIALHLLLVFLKMGSTLCCVSLGRCCLGPETRVIIKISEKPLLSYKFGLNNQNKLQQDLA